MMRFFRYKSLLLCALAVMMLQVQAWADKFGAIAYSPSTGQYSYSNNCRSRAQAEEMALARCLEPDARIAVWVKDGWAVLYRNPDTGAWKTAWSVNNRQEAEFIAQSSVPGGSLLCWVFSGR